MDIKKKFDLAIQNLNWPYWYQSCLIHLNNFHIRNNNPENVVFYFSPTDTFVNKKFLTDYLTKFKKIWGDKVCKEFIELFNELYADMINKSDIGKKQGIDENIDYGTDDNGILITSTFVVVEYKNGKIYKEDKYFNEHNNDFVLLKTTRERIPTTVNQVVSDFFKPKEKEEDELWKKKISDFLKIYYSKTGGKDSKGQSTIDNLQEYLKDFSTGNKNLYFNIRKLTHGGGQAKTEDPDSISELFRFINKEGKEFIGKFVVLGKYIITKQTPDVSKVSKHKREDFNKMVNEIQLIGQEVGEKAADYEIRETFKQFYELIFDDKDEVKLGEYTLYKNVSKPVVLEEEEKIKQIEEYNPEEITTQSTKLVLPLVFGNKMDDKTMKALEEAQKLQQGTKEKVELVKNVVEKFKQQSRPGVNVKQLTVMKAKPSSPEEKRITQKTSKKTTISQEEEEVKKPSPKKKVVEVSKPAKKVEEEEEEESPKPAKKVSKKKAEEEVKKPSTKKKVEEEKEPSPKPAKKVSKKKVEEEEEEESPKPVKKVSKKKVEEEEKKSKTSTKKQQLIRSPQEISFEDILSEKIEPFEEEEEAEEYTD